MGKRLYKDIFVFLFLSTVRRMLILFSFPFILKIMIYNNFEVKENEKQEGIQILQRSLKHHLR